MTTLEKPNASELIVELDFAEAIVAIAGIQKVKGEDCPMLERTTDQWDRASQGPHPTLMDQICCTSDRDSREYDGQDSLAIIEAIWAIATDPESNHQPMAVHMLQEVSDKAYTPLSVVGVTAEELAEVVENKAQAEAKQEVTIPPALPRMEIRGGTVVLRGFEQYVATRRAASEFLGNDCELLTPKHRARGEGYNLAAVRHTVSTKDKNEAGEFSGTYGVQILEALHKAAERNETIYDQTAAYMLAHAAVFEEVPVDNNVTVISRNVFGRWQHTRARAAAEASGGRVGGDTTDLSDLQAANELENGSVRPVHQRDKVSAA